MTNLNNSEERDVSAINEKHDTPLNQESEELTLNEQVKQTEELPTEEASEEQTDYEALAREDMKILCEKFPELSGKKRITELDNPIRFAQLRDLGLSPEEAYLATSSSRAPYNNKGHLTSAVPRGVRTSSSSMSHSELESARELFSTLSDADIQRLYKRVTK